MQPYRFAASLLAVSVTLCASDAVLAAGPAGVGRAAAPAGAAVSAPVARPGVLRASLTPHIAPARFGYWQRRAYDRRLYRGREYLPYAGVGGAYLRRRWLGNRWVFGGADDPPWVGQLTPVPTQVVPVPVPEPYWGQAELPRASFPTPRPYAPPTFQIIGEAPTRNMQRPVKLTQGARAREVVNTDPRIIWLDRKGNVVADNRGTSDPHVRYMK